MTPSEPASAEPVEPLEPVPTDAIERKTTEPAEHVDLRAQDVRRLHPLTPFFELILLGRQFAFPLLLALFAGRDSDRGQLLFVIPVVLGTVVGVLKWWRFTYAFDGRRLVIDEGVLTRKQRVVPIDRIQQVEMMSKLRHRLLGVTVLRVDTASGGGAAEVDLSVVAIAEAARLRAAMLPETTRGQVASFREGSLVDTADQPAQNRPVAPLVQLGLAPLALAGMTGSELAVMFTIIFWFLQFADDLPESFLSNLADDLTAPSSLGGFALAALALLAAWFGLAAAASILKSYGFAMWRTGDDLRVSRGLFDRREGSMPLQRLQAVRVQQAVVRRALGLVEVVLQSAGSSTTRGSSSLLRIDVPILERTSVRSLLAQLLPSAPTDELRAHPRAARRRAIVRRLVPAVILAGPAALLLSRTMPWFAVAVIVAVALALVAVAGELAYRGLGHAWADGLVVARAGGVARETVIVAGAKAQSTRVRTTPFQRRAGLATLYVDVAGKGQTPSIRDADADELAALQADLRTVRPS